jgi:ribulose kinase
LALIFIRIILFGSALGTIGIVGAMNAVGNHIDTFITGGGLVGKSRIISTFGADFRR